jgi:hypothetical protein
MTRYNTRNAEPNRSERRTTLALNRRKMAVLELLEAATVDTVAMNSAKAGDRFLLLVLKPWPENASLKGPRVRITLQEAEVAADEQVVNLLGQIKESIWARFGRGEDAFEKEPVYEKDGWVNQYARMFADRYGYVADRFEDRDRILRPDHEVDYQVFKTALLETLAVGTMFVYRSKDKKQVISIAVDT